MKKKPVPIKHNYVLGLVQKMYLIETKCRSGHIRAKSTNSIFVLLVPIITIMNSDKHIKSLYLNIGLILLFLGLSLSSCKKIEPDTRTTTISEIGKVMSSFQLRYLEFAVNAPSDCTTTPYSSTCFTGTTYDSGSGIWTGPDVTCSKACAAGEYLYTNTFTGTVNFKPSIFNNTTYNLSNGTISMQFPRANDLTTDSFNQFKLKISGGSLNDVITVDCSFYNHVTVSGKSGFVSITESLINNCSGFSCTMNGEPLSCEELSKALK